MQEMFLAIFFVIEFLILDLEVSFQEKEKTLKNALKISKFGPFLKFFFLVSREYQFNQGRFPVQVVLSEL